MVRAGDAAHGAVDCRRAVAAGNRDGHIERGADPLEHFGGAHQARHQLGRRGVVQAQALGGGAVGQFSQGKVLREFHRNPLMTGNKKPARWRARRG